VSSNNIFKFIVLVLLQVLVFNSININGYIDPYIYIYIVLVLPFNTKPWVLLFSSFLLGMSVDIFSNTTGIHAAATTFAAFIRPSVIRLFTGKQNFDTNIYPSIRDMGLGWFYKYALLIILAHQTVLFTLETFKFTDILRLVYRISFSSGITLAIVILMQYLFLKRQNK